MNDLGDIANVAKNRMKEVAELRKQLPVELHERFDELMVATQRELDTDPNLHDGEPPRPPNRVQERPAKYRRKRKTKLPA
jgi:hypothetical protein